MASEPPVEFLDVAIIGAGKSLPGPVVAKLANRGPRLVRTESSKNVPGSRAQYKSCNFRRRRLGRRRLEQKAHIS